MYHNKDRMILYYFFSLWAKFYIGIIVRYSTYLTCSHLAKVPSLLTCLACLVHLTHPLHLNMLGSLGPSNLLNLFNSPNQHGMLGLTDCLAYLVLTTCLGHCLAPMQLAHWLAWSTSPLDLDVLDQTVWLAQFILVAQSAWAIHLAHNIYF